MTTDMDTAYANAAFIPNAQDFPPRWKEQAAAFRARLGARGRLGLTYGPSERQRFDLFLPESVPHGLAVFIHGGFWRAFGREDWSHLAAGALERGWACALPSYTLAPKARIAQITGEMASAVSAAAEEVSGPLVITGHSAGGHLAARMACDDVDFSGAARMARIVPISPLSNLRPLIETAMNDDLRIDAAEAAAESPVFCTRRAEVDCHVWVGGDERPAFVDQAQWLGAAWEVAVTVEPGRHHFDVIDGLEHGESALCGALFDGL